MNSKQRAHYPIVIALALLLASCTAHQATPSRVNDVFANSKQSKVPPAQKPQPPTLPQDRRAGQKFFNVSVHNIEAREFFMGLVMDSNENVVVHPEVSGTISLELKNVTLTDVIKVVSKVYGYDYEKTDMGYIIYPATLHTRSFKINRLDLLREGRSNTSVVSGQNTATTPYGGTQGYGGGYSQQSFGTQQGFGGQQGFGNQMGGGNYGQTTQLNGSSVRTTNNTDFWKELTKALQEIIAIDDQASVSINQQSGIIIARAKPMQLHEIESFLNTTQKQISRQVILEAKIVEVVLNDSHQDGVNWKILTNDAVNVLTAFGAPNPAVFASIMGKANPEKFTAIFTSGSFTAMVELLSTQGKTNVLSSPKISTLNNQKAIIRVGKDEYFVTGVSSNNSITTGNAITGINNTALPSPTMASFFSGIALDVTPQIDDQDNITLHIHPSITRVSNLEKVFTLYGQDYSLPTPLNEVRESDSIVTAQSGQLIVLGGLMQETSDENKEGISGLATIPYIGHLFRMDTGKTQKTELIILLKASVIEEPTDWQNSIDSSKQRYQQLDARPMWQ